MSEKAVDITSPVVPTQTTGQVTDIKGSSVAQSEQAQVSTSQADPRLMQLARKERALARQMREFQAQKQAWEAQRNTPPPQPAGTQWDKSAFMKDPMSYGFTPDELSQTVLGALSQDPQALRIRQLEAKLSELEGKQSATLSTLESQQKQNYEQAKKQITSEVQSLVRTGDAYEAIKATGSEEAVVALIEATYQDDGILMSVDEAAREVEAYLIDEAARLSALKSVQAKTKPPEAAPPQGTLPHTKTHNTQQTHSITVAPKTLSNTMSAAAPSNMTAKQRRERAILAFQGKLTG